MHRWCKVVAFGAAALAPFASRSAEAAPYQCGTWVYRPAHIANGQRGDILLTRVDGAPAGAVTDPLGQTYTHSGILTDEAHVRHNTSILHDESAFDNLLSGAVAFVNAIGDSDACYSYASVPPEQLRHGSPGLGTNAVADLGSLAPWNTDYLALLKPRNEGAARAEAMAAATASEGMTMFYDVFSYKDYNAALAQGGNSMCSGAVKHATDLAGFGGFALREYLASDVNKSAANLYQYIYSRAHAKIDAKDSFDTPFGTAHLLSWQCREKMAAGLANEVVDCFATGRCARDGVKWSGESGTYWSTTYFGGAESISPDDLFTNQPASAYETPIPAQVMPGTWELQSKICYDGRAQLADYDGDGKSDFALYRPSEGRFYVRTQAAQQLGDWWGVATDIPIWGDYDGDKITDFAVWRANANGATATTFVDRIVNRGVMGTATSVPTPADYDGDGKTDYAYYDPSISRWAWGQATGPLTFVDFGASGHAGTVAVPADYDGDGKADLAVWRPWSGDWVVHLPTGDVTRNLGAGGIAVPGDYDGDRKADFVVFRDGQWSGVGSTVPSFAENYGTVGDVPVPADYDGDGQTDYAVWRPSLAIFYVILSSQGTNNQTMIVPFGKTGDVPVAGRYNR
jgi:hypothetical protein